MMKLLRTFRAVLWSFLGIRKGAAFQEDIKSLTPFHIIGVGFVLCFLFVIALMLTVRWVVKV